jgi:hypothetical protein
MSPSSFRLIERTGPNPGTVYNLDIEVMIFGREVGTDIVLGDSEISRQHARITHTPGGYVLEDLGSTNGTFVNGERLTSPRVLDPGDLIGLGENVTLTFDAVSPEAAATVARRAVAVPQPSPVQPAPIPQVVVQVPAAPTPSTTGKSRLPLALAGGGCLVIFLAGAAVLYFMPASWWCVLLTPLQFLGFNFAGC